MSLTRQVWKPWRAKTRTAASRIRRRFSAALAALRAVAISESPVDLGSAVGERGQLGADPAEAVEVEVGDHLRLGVRGLREDEPPGVDDHRAPAGAQARGVAADLVGGHDEALVLDRAGAHQHLPVVARGGL